ncbi:MAG: hypothetical protein GY857_20405, partial [Desulfobacula sp.]|nr:hypothetical protein [Desulfobacula sp.]
HFSKALKTGENPYFVNKWCIIALRRSNVDGAGEEAVKIVNEWRKQKKIPLEPSQQKSILGIVLEQFSRYDYKSPEKTFLPRLITLLPAREIKETYLWLIEQSGRQENERLILYRLGLISEVDGDFQTAFNHYIEIIERLKTSNRGHYPLLGKKALCRLLTKGLKKEVIFSNVQIMDIPKNIIALGDTIEMGMTFARNNSLSIGSINEGSAKKGGLMIGDNFLMIDNVLFESRYKFNKILKDIVSENRSYADLFLLRDGKIISYRFVKEK